MFESIGTKLKWFSKGFIGLVPLDFFLRLVAFFTVVMTRRRNGSRKHVCSSFSHRPPEELIHLKYCFCPLVVSHKPKDTFNLWSVAEPTRNTFFVKKKCKRNHKIHPENLDPYVIIPGHYVYGCFMTLGPRSGTDKIMAAVFYLFSQRKCTES